MSQKHGALVLVGSGPGIGQNVAALFAERGFDKVILMSRDVTRLSKDAEFVRSASTETQVFEIPIDLGSSRHVQESLARVDQTLNGTPLECVFYNAARTTPSKLFDFDSPSLENDLRISIISLYDVARWATPRLLKSTANDAYHPSLLVTSGMLAKEAFPAMFALASGKAGQYSLVQSLHKELEPKGIHCGVLIIAGTVSLGSKVTNPRNIAEEAWKVFARPKGSGVFETIVQDPAFTEHVKNREK